MARLFYCLVLYLGSPLVWLRLLWRSRRQPEYLRHLGERWGFYAAKSALPVIWVHAVSVGETRAAEPLVRALIARYPGHTLLLTGMTPTGREAASQVYGGAVLQAYLPYDYPGAVRRFLAHFRPRFGVLMETEVWPNLLAACADARVPVFLANARLSERSARGYARFGALARPAFAALSGAAAQGEDDAARLRALGVRKVAVCGNLKFDVRVPETMREQGRVWRAALGNRPVWLAASTREGEEALILEALAKVDANALLVLVPRHPQRFAAVAEVLQQRGLTVVRRSVGLPDSKTQVWLGDSMGEMGGYYTLADVAFVGGSLLPLGGQNLIEAAACGCPVLVGPHTYNFTQATEDAIAGGAACRVEDAAALGDMVSDLLRDDARRGAMRVAALAYASAHGGATEQVMAFIEASLP